MSQDPAVRCAVRPGDRVALVLRNSVRFLEISAGISAAGAGPVPVNWQGAGRRQRRPGGRRERDVPELETWLGAQSPVAEAVPGPLLGMIYTFGTTGRPNGIARPARTRSTDGIARVDDDADGCGAREPGAGPRATRHRTPWPFSR